MNGVCGVEISVMVRMTLWTGPNALGKVKGFMNVSTVKAAFTRRIPPVNLDQCATIPCGFVLQLSYKLAPSHIADRFSETMVLDHILDRQTLDADHLVLANHACRELMPKITATVSDTGMNLCHLHTSLLFILRAFFPACMPTLCMGQSLLIVSEELRIPNGLATGEHDKRLDTQVGPNATRHNRQGFHLLRQQKRDEVATCTILRDDDARWLARGRQRARPTDSQRLIHLCQGECYPVPGKCRRHIGCRLLAVLLVEFRVLRSSLEEVHKRFLQVAKFLLQGNARYLIQPGVFRLLFKLSQSGTTFLIVEANVSLIISIRTFSQGPIIDHAAASKGTSKSILLCISRVEPILKSVFVFHGLHDSIVCAKCLYIFSAYFIVQRFFSLPKKEWRGRCEWSPAWGRSLILREGCARNAETGARPHYVAPAPHMPA